MGKKTTERRQDQDEMPALTFGGPAIYRVTVQGSLGPYWCARLSGMSITSRAGKTGEPQTSLMGPFRDQAELSGLLETLYNLHMPLITVEQVEAQTKK